MHVVRRLIVQTSCTTKDTVAVNVGGYDQAKKTDSNTGTKTKVVNMKSWMKAKKEAATGIWVTE